MSLMASPSSFPSCNYKFDVFSSFHGPDVRKTLLSHMRKQFSYNGITMFDDQGIERSEVIAPSLKKGIKESRILIVILSKKYSSSSWCLDELVEILKCKEVIGQIVMTIFYGVEPSDVRNQTGEFGIAFNDTCARKMDEGRQKWSKALNEVGNIAGEDFFRWDNEAKMIEKIAKDVSDKLNTTPSRDFDGMVGLEAHLREVTSLLDLDNDGVKMVAITGPAGIGKTTIARALQSQIYNRFQLTCFVDNLRGSYLSGLDVLRLQEQFLSHVLNQDGIRIHHSGVIKERLCKQRVLIMLDDVNHIRQLEALANETTWFGSGSRIVVTTENKELLQQHGIDNMYNVGFPSGEEAIKILCSYAFRKESTYHGFEELAIRVTKLCGNLPLGLRVVGSSLRGKNEEEWEEVIRRLETILDHQDIEEVLRVGYESLHENEQSLFLHIAVFFNYENNDLVEAMFAESDLDVKYGLKILEKRSLIEIRTYGERIEMHILIAQVGKKTIYKQDPWKRQILIDADEICDVLEHAKGTRVVSGISFDISNIDEVSISPKAFKRMPNLRFLRVYKRGDDRNYRMHIPEEMEFPRRLRFLYWEAYPGRYLSPTFHPEYLVELDLRDSKLEYLWQGTKQLTNLNKMNLFASYHLKELPDLSNATNLERLDLRFCRSLVEIPSSCSHLHKLLELTMENCTNLQVIPANMNLASLEWACMSGCSRLRNIPVISTNITQLFISRTAVEGVPPSIRFCSSLNRLCMSSNGKLEGLTHLPPSILTLDLSYSDIQKISDDIKALHGLQTLDLSCCKRLASLPELPGSLTSVLAKDCESLETISCPLNNPNAQLDFTNCFKLGQQARRAIIQRSFRQIGSAVLPGREILAEFDQRAEGNCLTIRPDGNRIAVCLSINLSQKTTYPCNFELLCCRRIGQSDPVYRLIYTGHFVKFQTEHLFMFHYHWLSIDPSEFSREVTFEFNCNYGCDYLDVIECGAKIWTDESMEGNNDSGSDKVIDGDTEFGPSETFEYNEPTDLDGEKHTDCLSWLFLCFDLLVPERRRPNPTETADDVTTHVENGHVIHLI